MQSPKFPRRIWVLFKNILPLLGSNNTKPFFNKQDSNFTLAPKICLFLTTKEYIKIKPETKGGALLTKFKFSLGVIAEYSLAELRLEPRTSLREYKSQLSRLIYPLAGLCPIHRVFDRYFCFRSYSSDDHANDLALIRLRRKGDGSGLKFNDFVTPACVPTYDVPDKEGTTCIVAGWGNTGKDEETKAF